MTRLPKLISLCDSFCYFINFNIDKKYDQLPIKVQTKITQSTVNAFNFIGFPVVNKV